MISEQLIITHRMADMIEGTTLADEITAQLEQFVNDLQCQGPKPEQPERLSPTSSDMDTPPVPDRSKAGGHTPPRNPPG